MARARVGGLTPLIGAIGLMSALASCDRSAAEPVRTVDAVYETRGIVMSLPDPDNPIAEFRIQHEAIDSFVHADGVMRGMNAMDMGFPAFAPGVSIDGLEVGDKVSFAFDVAWTGDPKYSVTRIEKIDPETELEFGLADPSSVASPDDAP